MAKKATKKKRPSRTSAKRATKRTSARNVRRASATTQRARASRRRPATSVSATANRNGLITHTELASEDPMATRDWCQIVLGWEFGEPTPTPTGPYHMWRFPQGTGGGILASNPPEVPGSIPYCEVRDIRSTFSLALERGARGLLSPEALPGGMGWIAIVAAPGGVPIGLWAPQ